MFPTSLPELAEAVRSHPRVLPVGARTKMRLSTFPAAEPQPYLLSTRKLTGITEYEPTEYTFTARAGTTLAELRHTLAAKGQYLPFDPLLADAGATLGGTVAAGLSGPGRFHYGGLRDFLLGATLADGSGQLLKLGAKVVKNAAGFDLPKFLIGSLGRFGVLGEITFKVFPLAPSFLTLRFPCESPEKAAKLLCEGARGRWELDALDYLPGAHAIVARLAGPAEANTALAADLENLWGKAERGPDSYWDVFTTLPSRWSDPDGAIAKIALTPGLIPAFLAACGKLPGFAARFCAGGHLGLVTLDAAGLSALDQALLKTSLKGLVLQGPSEGPLWLGGTPADALSARIQKVMDPAARFPVFA